MAEFTTLRDEYSRFYAIRNHPADDVEFEEWQQLQDEQVSAWADRMQTQGAKVKELIGDLDHMKPDRAYHELKCYFREDVAEVRKQLKTRNIEFVL